MGRQSWARAGRFLLVASRRFRRKRCRMFFNVKQLLDAGFDSKWYRFESAEECKAIVDSIAGENMVRNASFNKMDGETVGNNLRHYIDRGHIVVHGFNGNAEKHPLDEMVIPAEQRVETGAAPFVTV